MKKSLLFFLLFAGFFAFLPATIQAQAVTGVTLNKHTLALGLWKSEQLTATVTPADATNKNVSWSSSNSTIISVDNSGYVTANKDGVATVYVKTEEGGFTDSCVVTCTVSDAANINEFSFVGESHAVSFAVDQGKITGFMPYGTDVANMTVAAYRISPGASIAPLPESVHDFSDTVQFVVTAPDGKTQKTWKVFPQVLPDLSGTQKIELTFKTAPQGWIADTVSWEENNIHFLIDYPDASDTTWPPSAEVGLDQDYSHEMGVSLFPASLRFYLEDTNKVIVAASMYILENCDDSCSYVSFSGTGGTQIKYIDKMTRSYHFFDLKNVRAASGVLRSYEGSFSGITFWITNKDGSVNHPPVADAGPDQTVFQGDTVHLDGTGSYDPDGDSISYHWSASGGILLTDSTGATPSFRAPSSEIGGTRIFSFVLVVNDGNLNSAGDTVLITVKQKNLAPVAWFDIDSASVTGGDTAYIDGHYSYDPNGDSLSFHWWTDPGAGIVFFDSTAMDVRCSTPEVNRDTTFNIYLKVDDGLLYSPPDTFYLRVLRPNRIPVADAGPDQTVFQGDTVRLDGTGSYDPDGDSISYHWSASGGILLTDSTGATPSFRAPSSEIGGTRIFSFVLVVNDGRINSAPDTVFITVQNVNHRPVAWIDLNQIQVNEGDSAIVEGHYSYDPDGDSLSYSWRAQAGSGIRFADSTAMDPRFGAPMVARDTTFEVYLRVSDGQLFSEPDTAYVHVIHVNGVPVAILQKHTAPVFDGDTVYLDGTASYDPDGDTLSYKWTYSKGIYLTDSGATAWFIAPSVQKETPYFVSLVVNDGKADSPPDVDTILVQHKNHAPVAVAGYPIQMNEGDSSYLYGSLSYDQDGDPLTYSWKIPDGFWIDDSTKADARIRAPMVLHDTVFNFILTVSDGQLSSMPDTCRVTVKNVNQAPVARIVSTEQVFYGVSVNEGDTLWIDGSPSYDPDGDPITYDWFIPKAIDSYHYDSVKVMIIAPEVTQTTSFDGGLKVNDGVLSSSKDLFIIRVLNVNKVPVAFAGKSFATLSGQTEELDGSGSYDPDGDSLRFVWIAPSGISLNDAHAVSPIFTAPQVTVQQVLTFKLVVSDGSLVSDTSTVEVTVKPIEATLRVAATVNDTTIPYNMRHITLYYQNPAGRWEMENVLSYNENGDTYYAVWEGEWMVTVDPVGDDAGFVTTFYGDVTDWQASNTFHVTGGAETQVTIHCAPVAAAMTGDGSIDGVIARDTLTAGTARSTISHVEGTRDNTVPAAGVTIFLYRSPDDALLNSTLTDKQGKYSFKNLPSGGYYLIVQLPGYDPNTPWTVEVSDDTTAVTNVNFVVSEGDQSITDINNRQELQAQTYPNPVNSYLNIRIDDRARGAAYRLYDITGHLIMSGKLENRVNRLDLGTLQKGIYLLNMRSNDKVVTRRIIKQ